jgi:hypothetical protein
VKLSSPAARIANEDSDDDEDGGEKTIDAEVEKVDELPSSDDEWKKQKTIWIYQNYYYDLYRG